MLTRATGLFRETFLALRGAVPSNFYTAECGRLLLWRSLYHSYLKRKITDCDDTWYADVNHQSIKWQSQCQNSKLKNKTADDRYVENENSIFSHPISFKFCTRPYTAEVSDSHMQNTQKFNTADNSQFECYWISSSPLKYQPIWMTFLVREPCDQNSKFLKFNCGLLPYWKYFLDKNSALVY